MRGSALACGEGVALVGGQLYDKTTKVESLYGRINWGVWEVMVYSMAERVALLGGQLCDKTKGK